MPKINIVYWDAPNFGDILSPFIVEQLSGHKTQFKHIKYPIRDGLKIIIKSLVRLQFKELRTVELPWQKNLVAIGSIISWSNRRSDIWGAGFMNADEHFRGGNIYAVRGPFTAKKLMKYKKKKCEIYGDPALLLPLLLPQNTKADKQKLGIIPHKKETDYFLRKYGNRYSIIDLRTRDINAVVSQITSCSHILSSSLHGVIVGQAYGIPALWIKKGYIDTDGFKFKDYFASVDIPLYDGIVDFDRFLRHDGDWRSLFIQYADRSIIQTDLQVLQRQLLAAAPFPLIEKYSSLISGI